MFEQAIEEWQEDQGSRILENSQLRTCPAPARVRYLCLWYSLWGGCNSPGFRRVGGDF